MADKEAARYLAEQDFQQWRTFRRESRERFDLSYEKFSAISIDGFDLSDCNFDGAYFDDCDLRRVNFDYCTLTGAVFRKCVLSSATFKGASFQSSKFDRCELDGVDFGNSRGLSSNDIYTSFGDYNTLLPEDMYPPESWGLNDDWDLSEEEDETEEGKGKSTEEKLPKIPERVFAPVETAWRGEILHVQHYSSTSNLSNPTEDAVVKALKHSLRDLVFTLAETNFDQRIVLQLRNEYDSFPDNGIEFRSKIFSTWYFMRPVFEHFRLTRDQHSEFLEAKVISFEMSLRDLLRSYPEWREYEQATQAVKVTDQFDDTKFIAHQIEFIANLRRVPERVDAKVADQLTSVVKIQQAEPLASRAKPILYGAASSFANVISRIIKKILDEIASGSLEGVKDGTKKLVSATIAAGGGGALLWFFSTGMESFAWLKRAWDFVKSTLSF